MRILFDPFKVEAESKILIWVAITWEDNSVYTYAISLPDGEKYKSVDNTDLNLFELKSPSSDNMFPGTSNNGT